MAAAKRHARGVSGTEVCGILWIDPGALAAQARLEALDSNDGEDKPEKAHQERNPNEKRSGFLETPENDLQHLVSVVRRGS
jgi:hypothetical protein